jgi:5'-nucleotidase / UDP-sugar diphosphatase
MSRFANRLLSSLAIPGLLAVSGCSAETTSAEQSEPEHAVCDEPETELLTFVHVSDIHGSFDPDRSGISPVARIRGLRDEIAADRPNVIFSNGGDDHEKGSLVEQISMGAATRDIIQALRFDVRVMGNHDFAWGVDAALAHARDQHAQVLASNVEYVGMEPADWQAKDTAIVRIGCLRVGFFGLVSAPWDQRDQPTAEDYFPEMPTRLDFAARSKELVAELRPQVDIVVLLSHLGIDEDMALADRVEGIDVILGGHSHSRTEEPLYVGQGTVVIHPGAFGRSIAQLDVVVDPKAKRVEVADFQLHDIDASTPWSEPVEAEVTSVLERFGGDTLSSTGWVKTSLSKGETAELAAKAAVSVLEVEAAVVDVTTTWSGLAAGSVAPQDFADSFPVERQRPGTPGFSAFYTVTLTGRELQKLITSAPERFVAQLPDIVDPRESYEVALPKREAFGRASSTFAAEVWQVLELLAQRRTQDCAYVDTDEALPSCGPL